LQHTCTTEHGHILMIVPDLALMTPSGWLILQTWMHLKCMQQY